MAAQSDMADSAFFLQAQGQPDDGTVEYFMKFFTVHIVYHADIQIVGIEACQLVFEGGDCLVDVACTQILVVFPGGAQMSLDDKLLTAACQRFADVAA